MFLKELETESSYHLAMLFLGIHKDLISYYRDASIFILTDTVLTIARD